MTTNNAANRSYEPPTISAVGSLRDLTLAGTNRGTQDENFKNDANSQNAIDFQNDFSAKRP